MRVLVTGSSGWLGRRLVPMLRERGDDVVGLDVAPSSWTSVLGSVADRPLVDRLFEERGFDAVVHAGALHKPDIARYPQHAFVDVNVAGTLNLLEAAGRSPGARFVFTSTTSLMISQSIRDERSDAAVWLDEDSGPIEPRNIYGVTKLAAEALCRQHHIERGMPVVVLRTSRFFPEDDDTHSHPSGPNLKANELLNRRATVEDMARAHLAALDGADAVGFGLFIVSAPTPFDRCDVHALKTDAASEVLRRFPEAADLYAHRGWVLPKSIGRVYDGSKIEQVFGFEYRTRFADVLAALKNGVEPPVVHDSSYTSPMLAR